MEHPNAAILRRADEAMERGDIEGFFSYYTDDVVVHVAGRSQLAGDHMYLADPHHNPGRVKWERSG